MREGFASAKRRRRRRRHHSESSAACPTRPALPPARRPDLSACRRPTAASRLTHSASFTIPRRSTWRPFTSREAACTGTTARGSTSTATPIAGTKIRATMSASARGPLDTHRRCPRHRRRRRRRRPLCTPSRPSASPPRSSWSTKTSIASWSFRRSSRHRTPWSTCHRPSKPIAPM